LLRLCGFNRQNTPEADNQQYTPVRHSASTCRLRCIFAYDSAKDVR
jgi:hypothetical protein